ncbi:Flp family type IVb pilin [Dongia deserti]|uniref:Flp family type IVb pilin n=1 Tax=Dongia deserti TaxID=2268030 RepID=UPI000E650450|nr:Flp family type IVb pilin [Dongia deserti]
MTKLRGMFVRLRKSEDGATMIEYSILIGIITAAAITLILQMGIYVSGAWGNLCNDVQGTLSNISLTC